MIINLILFYTHKRGKRWKVIQNYKVDAKLHDEGKQKQKDLAQLQAITDLTDDCRKLRRNVSIETFLIL